MSMKELFDPEIQEIAKGLNRLIIEKYDLCANLAAFIKEARIK